jgi:hypothetical protein
MTVEIRRGGYVPIFVWPSGWVLDLQSAPRDAKKKVLASPIPDRYN